MNDFLIKWSEAAETSLGFFWMALWAFGLGYLMSSFIQVFVTEKRMRKNMGQSEKKGVLIGTFFGFISSSCSFAALATTKSLFKKGAGFVPAMAYLLASTNLVIELGIIISIFLGWQFIVGEYVGGILLILVVWILVKIFRPKKIIEEARKKLDQNQSLDTAENKEGFKKEKSWAKVGRQYGMEWKMVWKDVTIGFTIAGIVAAFIPNTFFETLFMNTGSTAANEFSFLEIMQHIVVGPIVAFMTFIGSMGNIPLAALLFSKGVSFAGVMAFIFSDLVVFPVVRINAKYYGWKMALFILLLLFISLIVSSVLLHYGFSLFDLLPNPKDVNIGEQSFFKIDYSFYLNIAFVLISGYLVWLGYKKYAGMEYMKEMANKGKRLEQVLKYLALVAYLWLLGGIIVKFWIL